MGPKVRKGTRDLRIKAVPFPLLREFKQLCAEEDLSYREMLKVLIEERRKKVKLA